LDALASVTIVLILKTCLVNKCDSFVKRLLFSTNRWKWHHQWNEYRFAVTLLLFKLLWNSPLDALFTITEW